MTEPLPRALFFTFEVPQSVNAGSMQLYRALQGYPGERLMVAGMEPEPGARRLPCRYATVPLINFRLACTRFREWAIGFNAWNTRLEPQLGATARLVAPFSPEVIVTVMDKLSYYKHAWALSRRLGVPLLTITMDDPQTFERTRPCLQSAYDRILRRIYGDAALSLGVSAEMCAYLKDRFGRSSSHFQFGPPEGIEPRAPERSAELVRPPRLTLGYAGSLSLGYREGLLAILPALAAADCQVLLYTKNQNMLFDHPNVTNRGFLPPEALWPAVQAECDAVLLPYSFGSDIAPVYRTHFPTKLSEYCWTGLPIVVTGPAYATGIKWGLRHPAAALTLATADVSAVAPRLQELRADGERRVSLADAAARIARTEFDPVATRQRFAQLLRAAAGGAGLS